MIGDEPCVAVSVGAVVNVDVAVNADAEVNAVEENVDVVVNDAVESGADDLEASEGYAKNQVHFLHSVCLLPGYWLYCTKTVVSRQESQWLWLRLSV